MVWGKRRDTVLHGEVPFNAELPSSALASGGKVTPLYAYAADSVVATLVSAGRSDRCWAYLATSRRRTCARPVGTAIMVADGRGRTTTTGVTARGWDDTGATQPVSPAPPWNLRDTQTTPGALSP
jgi:hypothetical protein